MSTELSCGDQTAVVVLQQIFGVRLSSPIALNSLNRDDTLGTRQSNYMMG